MNSLLRELKKLVKIDLIELNRQVKKQLGFRMVSSIDTDLVVIETELENEIHEFIVNNNKKKLIEVDFPNTEVIKELTKITINVVAANDFVSVGDTLVLL